MGREARRGDATRRTSAIERICRCVPFARRARFTRICWNFRYTNECRYACTYTHNGSAICETTQLYLDCNTQGQSKRNGDTNDIKRVEFLLVRLLFICDEGTPVFRNHNYIKIKINKTNYPKLNVRLQHDEKFRILLEIIVSKNKFKKWKNNFHPYYPHYSSFHVSE